MKNNTINNLFYDSVLYVTNKFGLQNPFRKYKFNRILKHFDDIPSHIKTTITKTNLKALENNYTHSQNTYPTLGSPGDESTETMLLVILNVLSKLKTNELIGVQPIEGPVGLGYQLAWNDEKETTLEVIKHTVEARTREFITQWNIEAEQDIKIHHDLDIKQEIILMISNEIAQELITEQLHTIKTLAEQNQQNEPSYVHATDIKQQEVEINKQGNQIARDTIRGSGNWIVASTSSWLVNHYARVYDVNTDRNDGPLIYIGETDSGSHLYAANQIVLDPDTILIGYKGRTSELDTGLIFHPYVLLINAGTTLNPETFEPRTKLMTRYSITHGKNAKKYYRVIKMI